MFASLPKLADKNFVIGFLLPALLGSVAFVSLFRDQVMIKSVYIAIWNQNAFATLTVVAIAVWTGSVLLLIGNDLFYKVLEGYRGPFNQPKWRKKMQRQFKKELDYLKGTISRFEGSRPTEEEKREYRRRFATFSESFPRGEHLVLPTRFGNRIRAFETYARRVYGVDAIPAWYRLTAVVPKDFLAQIADARAQVNFFVNVWVLAVLFAGLAVGRFLLMLFLLGLPYAFILSWGFLVAAGVAVILAYASYCSAVFLVKNWGEAVKSAFDLYLPALAKQLGYNLPARRVDRERFWDKVTSMFLYRQSIDPEQWSWAGATGEPKGRPIETQAEAEVLKSEAGNEAKGSDEDSENDNDEE
jgi:hypothetical protein